MTTRNRQHRTDFEHVVDLMDEAADAGANGNQDRAMYLLAMAGACIQIETYQALTRIEANQVQILAAFQHLNSGQ